MSHGLMINGIMQETLEMPSTSVYWKSINTSVHRASNLKTSWLETVWGVRLGAIMIHTVPVRCQVKRSHGTEAYISHFSLTIIISLDQNNLRRERIYSASRF